MESSTFEKRREEMTLEDNIEWTTLVRDQVCAVCGGDLIIEGVRSTDSMRIVCRADSKHAGFRQRDTARTELRRGGELTIEDRQKIEKNMLARTQLNRAMNLLAMRFPSAIKDVAGAALFINDCMRLGLDPLIQPAEAVPVPFRSKDKQGREKTTVAMVVTEDGALSMAARGCPEEYDGAPATMPLLDYLMREHPQRHFSELEEMARRTARELCDDEKAYVWVALGKRRSATEMNPVYGYYTQNEWEDDRAKKLPAAQQPGNQARVRAIKRWVRENFPEARQKMLEYTSSLAQQEGRPPELGDTIDAEFTLITGPPEKKTPLISPPGGRPAPEKGPKPAANQATKKTGEKKVAETAERETENSGGPGAAEVSPAAQSGAGEDNLFSPQQRSSTPPASGPAAAAPWPPRDPDSIKTINDLYRACYQDFNKMQPNQVIKELGLSSQSQITETPPNCYRQIAEVRRK